MNSPDIVKTEWECLNKYSNWTLGANYCRAWFDDIVCWEPSPPGIATHPCPIYELEEIIGFNQDVNASRICGSDGEWMSNKTDFSLCRESDFFRIPVIYYVIAYIIVIGSVLSLISLAISLFIFFYFKVLHCSRLKVHRNLCVALIIYLVTLLIPVIDVMFLGIGYFGKDWFCKPGIIIHLYAMIASTVWMFLEGLLLHSRVTTHIFQQDAPFKLYYSIGWGLPALMVGVWAILTSYENDERCWLEYKESSLIWLITGPMLIALVTNTLFLTNIIRVLVTRQQITSTAETMQIRKAVKATALLFPLLGIPHLLFCVNPNDKGVGEFSYFVFNAFIKSSQGLFVAILYCFMNSDVQTALKNAYSRMTVTRHADRTSSRWFRISRGLSQTSSTYYASNSESTHQYVRKNRLSSRASSDARPANQTTKYVTRMSNTDPAKSSMV